MKHSTTTQTITAESITMEQYLGNISGGEILDIGTGDGAFIHFLRKHLRDVSHITGVDLNEKSLSPARTAFETNPAVTFQVMAGETLQFPDHEFDMVCLSNSLHHIVPLAETFQEMQRVVKPGGYILINEMFCDGQNERQLTFVHLHHWRAEIDRLRGIFHGQTLTKQEVMAQVRQFDLSELACFEHRNTAFDTHVKPEQFAKWHREYVEQISTLSEYPDVKERGDRLIQRIFDVGVEFATQLLCAGKTVMAS
jgi:ubiquinone/menaquinone biosynthesis C-methylase UbiE